MEVRYFDIEGLCLGTPRVFRDTRGYFFESYNENAFKQAGIHIKFVQNNQSFSTKGVLRGLHYQVNLPQAKCVRVVTGEVWDVAVDIRPGSPTFGKWEAVTLNAENPSWFLIPEGFAHGFQVLSETATFLYMCSNFYSPQDERGIIWNDPQLNIPWPIKPDLSPKDLELPLLKDLDPHEKRN